MRLRGLSRGFINLMLLLGGIGVGLWLLGMIAKLSAGTPVAPVGGIASRYKQFATTGT